MMRGSSTHGTAVGPRYRDRLLHIGRDVLRGAERDDIANARRQMFLEAQHDADHYRDTETNQANDD
jgi:hypothetical protein